MASTHVYKIMVRPNGETCPGISNSFCFRLASLTITLLYTCFLFLLLQPPCDGSWHEVNLYQLTAAAPAGQNSYSVYLFKSFKSLLMSLWFA